MSHYVEEIDILLAKMFALKRDVLPANRNGVDQYLHHVWTRSTTLTAAFRRPPVIDKWLLNRFKDYTQDAQKRLTENLKAAKYNIDGEDTLRRICGPEPIEKVFTFDFPLNDPHNVFFSTFSLFYASS